jgi:hypothetical protein
VTCFPRSASSSTPSWLAAGVGVSLGEESAKGVTLGVRVLESIEVGAQAERTKHNNKNTIKIFRNVITHSQSWVNYHKDPEGVQRLWNGGLY